MAIEWPLDKLGIINSALSQCGDNLVNAADDGSDEWTVASPAYERGLAYLLEQHSWYWTKNTVVLTPAANAPTDTNYRTAYDLPPDLMHIIKVRVGDNKLGPWMAQDWDFQVGPNGGMQLVAGYQGTTAQAVLTLQYLSTDFADPQFASPTFVVALQAFVMAGIYRGLHEDPAQADKMFATGQQLMEQAKTRHDQQRPKRAMWNSRISMIRRGRLPMPPWPRWNG
jgi:hypothetical protein